MSRARWKQLGLDALLSVGVLSAVAAWLAPLHLR